MSGTNNGAVPDGTQFDSPATISPTGHRNPIWLTDGTSSYTNVYLQVHPGHISNDNKAILTVPLVLLTISIIVVGLRVWTRARLVRYLGWDDYWIIGALLSNIIATMLTVAGTFKGEGSHITNLEDEELTYVLKLLYVEVILQPITLNLIKFSILSFYMRLPGPRYFVLLTKLTYAFVAAMMVSFVLTLTLACVPVSRQWDPYETRGGCIDRAAFWHVILALNVATNLWILFLPIKILFALKVERRLKVMVFCIFGVGAVATIASILGLIELPLAINDSDKTWGSWRLAVYAALENNLGIVAASAPALKPLIGKTVKKVSSVGTKMFTSPEGPDSRGSRMTRTPLGAGSNQLSQHSARSKQQSTSGDSHHGFHIAETVRKIISPRGSLASSSHLQSNRTGNTSFQTALASRSHRDSAILDTIGVLPTQAAFPPSSNDNAGHSRRSTRVYTGWMNTPAEIQHIRDWQLEENDYCLDPNIEHNLPRKPKPSYKRDSVESNPSYFSARSSRRPSQVPSMEVPTSPMEAVRRNNLEIHEEDPASGEADDQFMSHEEWKQAGGYV